VKLHLYGKREPRPGRKMGHYTVLGDDLAANLALALDIQRALVPSSAAVGANMQGAA
jgi:5-(carboxyamino)imidazole ribonucleotide synthase